MINQNGSTILSVDTIRSFKTSKSWLLTSVLMELKTIFKNYKSRKIIFLVLFSIVSYSILISWSATTNSMALKAYSYLILFDIFTLCVCLISLWVEITKPSPAFTFGYERFEVLAVFSASILIQFGSLFIIKESFSRFCKQPDVHTGRLLLGNTIVFVNHMIVVYGQKHKALAHVVEASSSSWLQEHVAEISQSLCHFVPGLSSFLLPRINPFVLVAYFGGCTLIITNLLIEMEQYHSADTLAGLLFAIILVATLFPISAYTGNILLQTMPPHVVGQLDKCLREALTLDGVLEFRKEHFWTLSFEKLSGSLNVRIRRDANEQLVLAHLIDRLSSLVPLITVQVFKDDWTRTSTLQILSDTDLANMKFSSITTTINMPPIEPSAAAQFGTNYSQLKIGNKNFINEIYPNETNKILSGSSFHKSINT